jgi:hypothetical protein
MARGAYAISLPPSRNRRPSDQAPTVPRQAPQVDEVIPMKYLLVPIVVVAALGFASAATPAFANADVAAWIKKCVGDNQREGSTPEVVAAYCSCMNGKMSDNETLSITAWEKTHPVEMASCDKESGWK